METNMTTEKALSRLLGMAIDKAIEVLRLSIVVRQNKQFYCSSAEDNKSKCKTQCLGCAGLEEQVNQ